MGGKGRRTMEARGYEQTNPFAPRAAAAAASGGGPARQAAGGAEHAIGGGGMYSSMSSSASSFVSAGGDESATERGVPAEGRGGVTLFSSGLNSPQVTVRTPPQHDEEYGENGAPPQTGFALLDRSIAMEEVEVLRALWERTCLELSAARAEAAKLRDERAELIEVLALENDLLEARLDSALAAAERAEAERLKALARADVSSRVAGPLPSTPAQPVQQPALAARPASPASPAPMPTSVRQAPASLRSFMQRACASGVVSGGLAAAAAGEVAALQHRAKVLEGANKGLSEQAQSAQGLAQRLHQQLMQAQGALQHMQRERQRAPLTPESHYSTPPERAPPAHHAEAAHHERARALESHSVSTLLTSLDNSNDPARRRAVSAGTAVQVPPKQPSLAEIRARHNVQLLTAGAAQCEEERQSSKAGRKATVKALNASLEDLPLAAGEPATYDDDAVQGEQLLSRGGGEEAKRKRRWGLFKK